MYVGCRRGIRIHRNAAICMLGHITGHPRRDGAGTGDMDDLFLHGRILWEDDGACFMRMALIASSSARRWLMAAVWLEKPKCFDVTRGGHHAFRALVAAEIIGAALAGEQWASRCRGIIIGKGDVVSCSVEQYDSTFHVQEVFQMAHSGHHTAK